MAIIRGVGKSDAADPFNAGSRAAAMALNRAGVEKCDFVMVFSSVGYDLSMILRGVRSVTGNAPVTHCIGEGPMTLDAPEGTIEFALPGADENSDIVGVMVFAAEEVGRISEKNPTNESLAGSKNILHEGTQSEIAENEKLMEACLKRAERMESIALFAGSVAHDLNNLFTSIIGFPSLLLKKIPKDDPMCIQLGAIKTCGEKAAAVVRELTVFSRKSMVNAVSFNVNDTIQAIIAAPEFTQLTIEHSGVAINTTMSTLPSAICGSAVDISKAINLLLANAFAAMKNGGVLSISTDAVCINTPKYGYDSIPVGNYVTVTIADTGTGIAKKHLDKIFDPYYSRKVMGNGGIGLGLAVVWGTVKVHNGFVDVVSNEGEGTTVTLYFPASKKLPFHTANRRINS